LAHALPGFIGGLLSGILGGYFAARIQTSYQLRAAATLEVRKLAIEARQAFHNWIGVPAYTGGPGDFHGGHEVGAKIDALSLSYRTQAEWLDDSAGEALERLVTGFGAHYLAHMEACSIKDWTKEQRETAQAAERWLNGELPRLLENVRALPWWRRLFR
jgi:hypothetical protein